MGRRGAACFPGKDKQQVLGCSAPGALSCNSKSGSKSSLASAPAPGSVTKQQGTTELSHVPFPKSAAETSKVWQALPQHLGGGPSLEQIPWILASNQQLFLFWTQCRGHVVLGKDGAVAAQFCPRFHDFIQLILPSPALKGWGEAQEGRGPLTAALFSFFGVHRHPKRGADPSPPHPADGAPINSLGV